MVTLPPTGPPVQLMGSFPSPQHGSRGRGSNDDGLLGRKAYCNEIFGRTCASGCDDITDGGGLAPSAQRVCGAGSAAGEGFARVYVRSRNGGHGGSIDDIGGEIHNGLRRNSQVGKSCSSSNSSCGSASSRSGSCRNHSVDRNCQRPLLPARLEGWNTQFWGNPTPFPMNISGVFPQTGMSNLGMTISCIKIDTSIP